MSELSSSNQRLPESDQFVPEVLPEVEHTSVEREAITERILDRVIDAAEHDEPLEREYEISHELKDKDAATSVPGQPMQSIGSILQQQVASKQPNDQSTAQNMVDPMQQTHQSPFADADLTSSYKQAIRYGVIAAVVVAVLLVIVALLKG